MGYESLHITELLSVQCLQVDDVIPKYMYDNEISADSDSQNLRSPKGIRHSNLCASSLC